MPPPHSGGKASKFILAADTEVELVEWQTVLSPHVEGQTRSEIKAAKQAVEQQQDHAMNELAQRFLHQR